MELRGKTVTVAPYSQMETITRSVQVVRGYKGIAKSMCLSVECVRDMVVAGAPIVIDGNVPRAETAELWAWYVNWLSRGKPKVSTLD